MPSYKSYYLGMNSKDIITIFSCKGAAQRVHLSSVCLSVCPFQNWILCPFMSLFAPFCPFVPLCAPLFPFMSLLCPFYVPFMSLYVPLCLFVPLYAPLCTFMPLYAPLCPFMPLYAPLCPFYTSLQAFTCFYTLYKLSSSQDLVVGLVLHALWYYWQP